MREKDRGNNNDASNRGEERLLMQEREKGFNFNAGESERREMVDVSEKW